MRQWSLETLVPTAELITNGTGRTMPPRIALALVEGTRHRWVAETRGSTPATSIPLEASLLDEA